MAAPTYPIKAIVLRKTKLGETDLVLTLLAQDGSQRRVVAKGARKPKSSFASRLELYETVDALCVKGRSLDIVSEVRLTSRRAALRFDPYRSCAAAPGCELLAAVTQPDLPCPRLFEATDAALDALARCPQEAVASASCALLLKTLAFAGLDPSLSHCIGCGAPVEDGEAPTVRFSVSGGGVVCPSCRASAETMPLAVATRAWALFFRTGTYRDIVSSPAPPADAEAVLQLIQSLCISHIGRRLKSLDFLIASGFMEAL